MTGLSGPFTWGAAPYAGHRTGLVTAVCAVAVLIVGVAGLVAGSSDLTLADALRTLVGAGSPPQQLIVLELRLPRVAAGLTVGAALGLAGALTQTFARNPLATPDILGVTSGAGLGAVAAIVLAGGSYSLTSAVLGLGLPVAATLGASVTALVVYGLAWRDGVDSYRLVLIGIGATAAIGGLTSFLIARAQITEAAAASQWLVGSLSGVSWPSVRPVLLALVVVAPVALAQGPDLDAGMLGDDVAAGLGAAIQRHRLLVLGCAVALTAAAVSASGPIGFVAFVAPQIAQGLAHRARPPLLASALVGSVVVTGGDAFARSVLPGEIPVGIITVAVGAPYLIWLLLHNTERKDMA